MFNAAPQPPTPPAKQPWTHLTHAEPGMYIIQRTSVRNPDIPPHDAAFLCTITHSESVPVFEVNGLARLRAWLSTGNDHYLKDTHLVRERTEVVWCLHIPDLLAFIRASEYPIILEEEHEGWFTIEIYDDRRE